MSQHTALSPSDLRHRSRRRGLLLAVAGLAVAALLAACGSGPSPQALAQQRIPTTTTTTEPPPEGVAVVLITNGAFRPSNLKIDLEKEWIVEWRHEDSPDREYVIEWRRDVFPPSPPLKPGDTYQVDFSQVEPGIYRYFAFIGRNRVPGTVDTRPEQ